MTLGTNTSADIADASNSYQPSMSSARASISDQLSRNLLSFQFDNEQMEGHHDQSSKIERLLYISHSLSTWNSRLFEFGAFLFLASIYPSSLLPASVYALARAASAAALSPWIGSFVDGYSRLWVIRTSIVGQRISTLLSCIVLAIILWSPATWSTSSGFAFALTILALLACIEKLCIIMNTISVERDWVVVIAGQDDAKLSRLNASMRRIDLFCKLVAPLAISFLDAYSTMAAVSFTGLISAVSCIVEYFAIIRVYKAVPELGTKRQPTSHITTSGNGFNAIWPAMRAFAKSPVILPSMALSLLYLTALSFAGQLITYLLAPPTALSALLLSVLRGVAAGSELSATFIAPRLIARIGLVRTGSWFLNIQLIFTSAAAVALWSTNTLSIHGQTALLVISVILSRLGLWGFDLAVQQQVQDAVPEQSRGTFSSIEAALQNLFEMISFASTIIWAKPQHFKYPGAISAGAVGASAVLYAAFVRQRRGHLFHWEQGLCGSKYWENHFGHKPVQQAHDEQQGLLLDDACPVPGAGTGLSTLNAPTAYGL